MKNSTLRVFITVFFLSLHSCSLFFTKVEITLINNTDDIAVGFYARDEYGYGWEDNLLDGDLLPGNEDTIEIVKGIYDFRAGFSLSDDVFLYDIDLSKVEIYTINLEK